MLQVLLEGSLMLCQHVLFRADWLGCLSKPVWCLQGESSHRV